MDTSDLPNELPNDSENLTISNTTINNLKNQQNFPYAIIGGFLATIIGAAIWAVVTISTEYQIGYMAIAVGLLVGFVVQFFGLGIDKKFGYLGAALSLLGCLLGNFLSQVGFIAKEYSLNFFETLTMLDFSSTISIMTESFSIIDLLFYGLAIYEGYRFAFRKVTPELLLEAKNNPNVLPKHSNLRFPLIIVSVLILSFLIFKFNGGVNGPKTYTYESGEVMSEGELKNSKLNGKWTYYYENGKVNLIAFYDKGVETGKWEWFDENGTISKIGHYERGLENGEWITYYDNKVASDSGAYVNGRKNGYWVYKYPNGNIAQHGNMVRDLSDGLWEFYFESGQLSSTGKMEKGTFVGDWTIYFENGQKSEENFHDSDEIIIKNAWDPTGKQLVKDGNGLYKSFSEIGSVTSYGDLTNGKKTGLWKVFYTNGDLASEQLYENNNYKVINAWDIHKNQMVKDGNGTFTSYYADGEKIYEMGEFKDGLHEGIWKTFHYGDSAIVSAEIYYTAGKINGIQKSFYTDGTVSAEGLMKDGLQEGEWKWYSENGTLSSSATFINGKKHGKQTMWNGWGEKTKEEFYENGEFINDKLFL